MLALSTRCAPEEWTLDRIVASLRDFGVDGVALHRPATPEEARALASRARRMPLVAVFGEEAGGSLQAPLLVVEGGAAGPDREASLEDLCRRLHALRATALALRTPAEPEDHPAPGEIALVAESLRNVCDSPHGVAAPARSASRSVAIRTPRGVRRRCSHESSTSVPTASTATSTTPA